VKCTNLNHDYRYPTVRFESFIKLLNGIDEESLYSQIAIIDKKIRSEYNNWVEVVALPQVELNDVLVRMERNKNRCW